MRRTGEFGQTKSTVGDPFVHLKVSKIVQKRVHAKKRAFNTKNRSLTDFSKIVQICKVFLIKNRENLKVQTKIRNYFSLLYKNDPKKTESEIFVIFSSEIRECPFLAFSDEQNRAKKSLCKKGVQKGPSTVLLMKSKSLRGQFLWTVF